VGLEGGPGRPQHLTTLQEGGKSKRILRLGEEGRGSHGSTGSVVTAPINLLPRTSSVAALRLWIGHQRRSGEDLGARSRPRRRSARRL
jgi:hypothetical protein